MRRSGGIDTYRGNHCDCVGCFVGELSSSIERQKSELPSLREMAAVGKSRSFTTGHHLPNHHWPRVGQWDPPSTRPVLGASTPALQRDPSIAAYTSLCLGNSGLRMDAIIDKRFERLEKALTTLINSVNQYHPSTERAKELEAADEDLSKGLEQGAFNPLLPQNIY